MNVDALRTLSRNPTIPTLVPEKNDVVKLLQSQKIEKKPAKYNAFKGIFQHRDAISTYLSALNLDADAFGAIEFGTRLRPVAGYNSKFLGMAMSNIRESLKPILPPSQHFAGLSEPLQRAITVVSSMVARAEHN